MTIHGRAFCGFASTLSCEAGYECRKISTTADAIAAVKSSMKLSREDHVLADLG